MIKVDNNINYLRFLYINIVFLLICIDFIIKEFIFVEKKIRVEILQNGFNYGERGKECIEIIIDVVIKLVFLVIVSLSIVIIFKRVVDE